jgi:Family of unknown function (DUF5906)
MLGYSLTGSTQDHALFFCHGGGANGKSVLLGTVANILGDYHTTAPIETFSASQNDRHPTELAALRGAHLVTATETQEGRPWDETKIKLLTGGDRISARFMRGDFFEFVPQFKLIIAGNHKPSLRTVDEAIRRRFHLVPFTVTIPPAERDVEFGRSWSRPGRFRSAATSESCAKTGAVLPRLDAPRGILRGLLARVRVASPCFSPALRWHDDAFTRPQNHHHLNKICAFGASAF